MMLEDPTLPGDERSKAAAAVQEKKALPGLSLELTVHNHHIVARDDACSVSHVVWEQRTPKGARLPLQVPDDESPHPASQEKK